MDPDLRIESGEPAIGEETAPVESPTAQRPISFKDVKANPKVRKLIDGANELLKSMGYTEHGQRHVTVVAGITGYIMENIGAPQREIELAQIAAYLHDIGNVINRQDHPLTGACIAYQILDEMGMDALEIAPILGAIGNHEEALGTPVSNMSAALIIADKSDVHYSRVQNPILESFDIHDRVNYAVQKSRVNIVKEAQTVELALEVDSSYASVMEYFEIFLSRMVMCRRSADTLGFKFFLNVNGVRLE